MRAHTLVQAGRLAGAAALVRAAALALGAAALSSCAEAPVSPRTPGVQLMISVASQVTTSRLVDVVVGYELTNGSVTSLLTSNGLSVAAGTQQVPVSVDLTKCLADANHAGAAGVCRLRVTVTLRDGTSGQVLDTATLPPIDAAPGSSPAPAAVSVAGVSSITVTGIPATMTIGQKVQAFAVPKDATGAALNRTVTWSSSNAAIGTVTLAGLVTAVAPGTFQVLATSSGVTQATAVTVAAPPPAPVASVTVSPSSSSVVVGGTLQLSVATRDANGNALTGRVVSFSSSAPSVATVNQSGVVTGITTGSATITATSEGQSGTATVSVANAPLLSVTPASMTAAHTVGTTTCPQTIGTATISNVSSGSVNWSASTTHPAVTLVSPTSGTLSAGTSASLVVRFNCSQTTAFSTSVTVTGSSGAINETRSFAVSVTFVP